MIKVLMVIFFSCGLISCFNSADSKDGFFSKNTNLVNNMTPNSYLTYVRSLESGLVMNKRIGGVNYELINRTSKEMAMQILKMEKKQFASSMIDSVASTLDSFQVFVFKISYPDSTREEVISRISKGNDDYKSLVEYFSYYVNKDMKLVINEDTIMCSMVNFERTYGVSPELTLNVFFRMDNNRQLYNEKTFVFNDLFFGSGIVKFRIEKESCDKLKAIKIS